MKKALLKLMPVLNIVVIVGTAIAAILVYNKWGLKGSAGLLAFWLIFMLWAQTMHKRAQKKLKDILIKMSPEEREALVKEMSEEDRAELLDATKGDPSFAHLHREGRP